MSTPPCQGHSMAPATRVAPGRPAHPARPDEPGHPPPPTVGGPAAQALSSKDLLRGHTTVTIAHNGSLYRLQATRQGKLILTK